MTAADRRWASEILAAVAETNPMRVRETERLLDEALRYPPGPDRDAVLADAREATYGRD